jgi:SAM-dependent methyltransferase
VIAALKRAYLREQFAPGALGLFINPFFLARRALWQAMRDFRPYVRGSVLDVGCGTEPYRKLYDVERYVGLEFDSPAARARNIADDFYDGSRFPYDDARFDTVLCNQVLEHVFAPDRLLSEIARVLKPGGRLVLTVPFVWDEHEQPLDYARYSSFGLRSLLERSGLRILEHKKLNPNLAAIFQLINAYLQKVCNTRSATMNLLICATLMSPFNLLGLVLGRLLPRNPDLYLDHAVLAEKP